MKSIEDDGNIPLTLYTQQAICAWPVSGQYGPGTRILYVAFASLSQKLGNTCRRRGFQLRQALRLLAKHVLRGRLTVPG
jgi:hypothetical protein